MAFGKSKRRPKKPNATGRADGEGSYVQLRHYMLRTMAWRSLKPGPRALLIVLYEQYNGSNNGDFFLSLRDATRRLNMTDRKATTRYFKELIDRGFLKMGVLGSFDRKDPHATTWILTEHKLYGEMPTKEFLRWQPPEEEKSRGRKKRAAGSKKIPFTPANWPVGGDLHTAVPLGTA